MNPWTGTIKKWVLGEDARYQPVDLLMATVNTSPKITVTLKHLTGEAHRAWPGECDTRNPQ